MGLFSSKSSTTVSTTNQSWQDSFNTNLSATKILENTGNVSLGLNTPGFNPGSAVGGAAGAVASQVAPYLPYVAGGLALFGAVLLWKGKA